MHRRAMMLFRQYMIVGGMPQAVQKYAETKDFVQVERQKRMILDLYRNLRLTNSVRNILCDDDILHKMGSDIVHRN